jgi:hypothetical protein
MAKEFNPNPWERTDVYIDRTYPSGVAGARPALTPRIHCEPEIESEMQGSQSDDRVSWFNRHLRSGLGTSRPSNTDE